MSTFERERKRKKKRIKSNYVCPAFDCFFMNHNKSIKNVDIDKGLNDDSLWYLMMIFIGLSGVHGKKCSFSVWWHGWFESKQTMFEGKYSVEVLFFLLSVQYAFFGIRLHFRLSSIHLSHKRTHTRNSKIWWKCGLFSFGNIIYIWCDYSSSKSFQSGPNASYILKLDLCTYICPKAFMKQ